jgi:hypothetical protein
MAEGVPMKMPAISLSTLLTLIVFKWREQIEILVIKESLCIEMILNP